jgi:hypothetical protein
MKLQEKVNLIEKEVKELKLMVMQQNAKKKISLKGYLKGIKVADRDIEKAKKSLFKH